MIRRIPGIDSHTGGEPARVVPGGGPDLGDGSASDQLAVFRARHDDFRRAVVNEPRGSDVLVGALLVPPCGTGTSARPPCLAADGRPAEGAELVQESIVGSVFRCSFRWADRGCGIVIPTITGTAHVTAEATLLLVERDPFRWGIQPGTSRSSEAREFRCSRGSQIRIFPLLTADDLREERFTMKSAFVSEAIKPDSSFDPVAMSQGEPGLPAKIRWRDRDPVVAGVLETSRAYGDCKHGSGERYLRRHCFRIRTADGLVARIYCQRTFGRARPTARSWLHSIEKCSAAGKGLRDGARATGNK